MNVPRIGALSNVAAFRELLAALGLQLPCDDAPLSAAAGSPLAQPLTIAGHTVGNRWCIHPMEGWDGTTDGRPTEHNHRRWKHFGQSGAKLIWGGEAVAVRPDGRANPHQLYYRPENSPALRDLHDTLTTAHREQFGSTDDLLVGLQLTHSGRFCRPQDHGQLQPRIAYHHPLLDEKFGIAPDDNRPVLTDDDLHELTDQYAAAALAAQTAGFRFVDVKCCHGYLLHEFLSAFSRPGPYGGDFDGRTRLLRETIAAIRARCPNLLIGVRLSLFDILPFQPDPTRGSDGKLGPGIPVDYNPRDYPAFGCRRDDALQIDLTEPIRLIRVLHEECGVALFNLTAGSPYYNPHIQRPAFYPPSDGYQPPEDPLVGCVRQIHAVRDVKHALPDVPLVGTAYTYFQEYLPHVAQAVVREGWVDFAGIGRLVLSDWDLPARVLAGGEAASKKLCRTFSDCTTAPRTGLISGCFPLDAHYKTSPAAEALNRAKAETRQLLRKHNTGQPKT